MEREDVERLWGSVNFVVLELQTTHLTAGL
jgi:hypothetical protein